MMNNREERRRRRKFRPSRGVIWSRAVDLKANISNGWFAVTKKGHKLISETGLILMKRR